MNNSREQSQEEERRQFQSEAHFSQSDKQAVEPIDHRHYSPIQTALRDEATGYDWKRETGTIHSHQHTDHHGWLHVDPKGAFYDRQANLISREIALEHAGHASSNSKSENQLSQKGTNIGRDQGLAI